MLKKLFHIALFLCLALAAGAQNPYLQENLQGGPPAPGPRTRSPLNSMSRAANNLPGATILTDTFGNQRLALFVHIEDTCINYTPAATGNTVNLSAFVEKCSTDSIWYIDWEGKSVFLGADGGNACDQDWLRISDNLCPDTITDSIYHYRYAAIGARLVWPSAEFLVNDSTNAVVQILSGNRNARLGFYDNFNAVYSTIDQSGTSTIWYFDPNGEFRLTTAGGGTPQSPGAPFINQFAIDPNDTPLPTVQAHQYPNTRVDTNTVRNFVYTDPLGKFRTQPLDSLIVIITDSIAGDTALQYNWYTRNETTTDLLRTATILQSAEWIGDDPAGYLLWQMGSLGGGRALIDTAAAIFHSGLGGTNIVQADAQGIDITTSNTASRAVNMYTDTVNTRGSFDDTNFRLNFLSDFSYLYADSLKVVGIGQFPGFPLIAGDGTDKGFIYDPTNNNLVGIINGDGTNGIKNYLFAQSSSLEVYSQDVPNQILANVSYNPSNIQTFIYDAISNTSINGNVAVNAGTQEASEQIIYTSPASEFDNLRSFVFTGLDKNYFHWYVGVSDTNESVNIFLGKKTPASFPETLGRVFSVFQGTENGLYQTILADMPNDTTKHKISFYNRAYYWKNEHPIGAAGDTLFHFWAATGPGGEAGQDPGFMTLDQVCAHCAADAVNIYNSNGITTDNTRIADVLETLTFRSEDVTADGVYPFRFELDGAPANEPEMMTWKFPTDSLNLWQSDVEIVLSTNTKFLLKADADVVVQADSFSYAPNLGGTGFRVGANNVMTQNAISGTATHRDAIEYNTITGTAQTEIFLDGSSAVWVVPTNSNTNFKIHVAAICSAAGNGVGITTGESYDSWFLGGIKRITNTTSLVGTVQADATAQADAGMSTSVVTIDADDTDESLRIRFTPPSTAGTTTVIRVVATLELTTTSY